MLNKIFIVSVLKFGEFCDFAEENGVKAYAWYQHRLFVNNAIMHTMNNLCLKPSGSSIYIYLFNSKLSCWHELGHDSIGSGHILFMHGLFVFVCVFHFSASILESPKKKTSWFESIEWMNECVHDIRLRKSCHCV